MARTTQPVTARAAFGVWVDDRLAGYGRSQLNIARRVSRNQSHIRRRAEAPLVPYAGKSFCSFAIGFQPRTCDASASNETFFMGIPAVVTGVVIPSLRRNLPGGAALYRI